MDAESLEQIQTIVTSAVQGLREEMATQGESLRRELRQEMAETATALRQEMAATTTTLREEMATQGTSLRQELRQEIAATATALRQEMAKGTGRLERRIDETAATLREEIVDAKRHTGILVEDLRHKLELVVEGHQVLDRKIDGVRTELLEDSRETRALLRLSYQQLHQRVETLERKAHVHE